MIKIRGCMRCKLGDCICDRVKHFNSQRNVKTPDDFKPGYRRKYLINIHGIDPDDRTNAQRYIEILKNYLLPGEDSNRRYGGDDGYRRFINDLDGTKTKPVEW